MADQLITERDAETMLECMLYVIENNAYDELSIPDPEKRVYEGMRSFSVNTISGWKELRSRVAELKSVV